MPNINNYLRTPECLRKAGADLARHRVVLQAIKCYAYRAAGVLRDRVFPTIGLLTRLFYHPERLIQIAFGRFSPLRGAYGV